MPQASGDWFDPESWKRYADLANEWNTVGGVIILVVVTVSGWATGFFRWAASKLRRAKSAAPSVAGTAARRLIFVVEDFRITHGPVGADEKTGTHVHGVFDVTDVSDRTFVRLKVWLGNHTAFMPGLLGFGWRKPDIKQRALYQLIKCQQW